MGLSKRKMCNFEKSRTTLELKQSIRREIAAITYDILLLAMAGVIKACDHGIAGDYDGTDKSDNDGSYNSAGDHSWCGDSHNNADYNRPKHRLVQPPNML